MADSKVSALAAVTVIGAADDMYVSVAGASKRITGANARLAMAPSYAKVSEQQAQNTNGGTFTSGAWRTRTLNTEDSDVDGVLTLASNQITLSAGTYECRIRCPVFRVGRHQARLYNVTDTSLVLLGASGAFSTNGSDTASSDAWISGKFTIAASKALEVQHICETTYTPYGFGVTGNFTTEIYAEAEFWKVG